jgi:DNA-binding transcriptional regulator YiaG
MTEAEHNARPDRSEVERKNTQLMESSNRLQIDFLRTELEVAGAFVARALTTTDATVRQRNQANAREAYDTYRRLVEKVSWGLPRLKICPSG